MPSTKVCLLGVGAMGSGYAGMLAKGGFDVNAYDPMTAKDKFQSPKMAADGCDVVLLAVVNSKHIETALFDAETGAMACATKPKLVISTVTVSPHYIKTVGERLAKIDVMFIDSPVSGGAIGARTGRLAIMAAGPKRDMEFAQPILKALGKPVPNLGESWGSGSGLKAVNQLLCGVGLAATAEARTLASRLGIDQQVVHDAIIGSGGNSWMWKERGPRMIQSLNGEEPKVESTVSIWPKDLGIVTEECKRHGIDSVLANNALAIFRRGVDMGLGRKDDSEVCQVYCKRNVEKSSIEPPAKRARTEGDHITAKVGDVITEKIYELYDEPVHVFKIMNKYCNAMRSSFPAGHVTFYHAHRYDSLYLFFNNTSVKAINLTEKDGTHSCACCSGDSVEAGEVRYGTHIPNPLIHKIECLGPNDQFCVDAEIKCSPPFGSKDPLEAQYHTLIKVRPKARVYKLELPAGQSIKCTYNFWGLFVMASDAKLEISRDGKQWTKQVQTSDMEWKEGPITLTQRNVGETEFVCYIFEYLKWGEGVAR